MAKCKYCHETISKLDKDICPFCGGLKPLEGLADYTEDFTRAFDPIKMDADAESKKRNTAAIFGFALGFFGGHYFYLGFIKNALIQLAINVVVVALLVLLPILLKIEMPISLIFFIALGLLFIGTNVFFGLRYLNRSDLKDAKGDLLR